MNISERTCTICRTKKPKGEIFRFVVNNEEVSLDKEQKKPGRGFYICSKECWEKGAKQKKKVKVSSRENKMVGLPEHFYSD